MNVFRWGHLVRDKHDEFWLRVLVATGADASWVDSYVADAVSSNDGRLVTAALTLSDAPAQLAAKLLDDAETRGLGDSVVALRAAAPKKAKKKR